MKSCLLALSLTGLLQAGDAPISSPKGNDTPKVSPTPQAVPDLEPISSLPLAQVTLGEARSPETAQSETAHSVELLIDNRTGNAIQIFWIDFEGKHQKYGQSEPSDVFIQGTFTGHLWLVTDTAKRPLSLFAAGKRDGLAVVGNQPAISLGLRVNLRLSGLPMSAESVTIPFHYSPAGFIVLDVQIDGKPVKLMLDTGSSCTNLSADAAREIGLKSEDAGGKLRGIAGELFSHGWALTKRMTLGDAWTKNEAVVVDEAANLYDSFGASGVLGMSTLKDWDVRIDPLAKKLTLFPSGKAPPMKGETVLPLKFESCVPTVPVKVGNHELAALPDTGAGDIVMLPRSLAEKFAPETMKDEQSGRYMRRGLTGEFASWNSIVNKFTFGPDTLRKLPLSVIERAGAQDDLLVYLGLDLLRHYVMTFRFTAGELRLKPLGSEQEITKCICSPFRFLLGPGYKVTLIDPGCQAARAGLRVGDEVLEFAGYTLRTLTAEQVDPMQLGSEVKIRYRRGSSAPEDIELILGEQ